MKNTNYKILIPTYIAIAVCVGILIGFYFQLNSQPVGFEQFYTATQNDAAANNQASYSEQNYSKLFAILNMLDLKYVDAINHDSLTEAALPEILRHLDPHSTYLTKEEAKQSDEDLEGSFSGIGVQFNIQNDTVMIVDVISGGPSEKLGILPGDRIVEVNDTAFVGENITNNTVVKKLRGEKGTQVKVGIVRSGAKEMLHYTITRGDIPVNSVDIGYKIKDGIGYIKVSRFGATTYNEFVTTLFLLKKEGCNKYIIDLRNNSGGYLSAVLLMVNEFLPQGELMLLTKGLHYKEEEIFSDGTGKFKNDKICVLINEWSASASEIFAGAVQDQDRGTVIGRRSFGKGLVQQPFKLKDGSELRLTIARYYTPSGRCIQKPYDKNDVDKYDNDIEERYNHGEFFEQDSIALNDSLKYTTKLGRTVYGGGGIMPDIFIGQDTLEFTSYYRSVFNKGILYDFTFQYSDKNRAILSQYKDHNALCAYLGTTDYIDEFKRFADKKGVKYNDKEYQISKNLIENLLQSYICRNILSDKGFYPVLNSNDKVISKAIEVLEANN